VLLQVLTVISLTVREAEHALLENRIVAVPQSEREAQPLPIVADPGDAIFAPVISARARLVVTEVLPGVTVFAVVLAHRAPLPLTGVGPPFLPGCNLTAGLFQGFFFCGSSHGDLPRAHGVRRCLDAPGLSRDRQ